MSPARQLAKRAGYSFPRVSGDEPAPPGGSMPTWAFSPRERG